MLEGGLCGLAVSGCDHEEKEAAVATGCCCCCCLGFLVALFVFTHWSMVDNHLYLDYTFLSLIRMEKSLPPSHGPEAFVLDTRLCPKQHTFIQDFICPFYTQAFVSSPQMNTCD